MHEQIPSLSQEDYESTCDAECPEGDPTDSADAFESLCSTKEELEKYQSVFTQYYGYITNVCDCIEKALPDTEAAKKCTTLPSQCMLTPGEGDSTVPDLYIPTLNRANTDEDDELPPAVYRCSSISTTIDGQTYNGEEDPNFYGINILRARVNVVNTKFTALSRPAITVSMFSQDSSGLVPYLGVSRCTFSKCTSSCVSSYCETKVLYCVFDQCGSDDKRTCAINLLVSADCVVANTNFTSCRSLQVAAISVRTSAKLSIARCFFKDCTTTSAPAAVAVILVKESSLFSIPSVPASSSSASSASSSNDDVTGSVELSHCAFSGSSATQGTGGADAAVYPFPLQDTLPDNAVTIDSVYTDQTGSVIVNSKVQTENVNKEEDEEKAYKSAGAGQDSGHRLSETTAPADDDDDGFPAWAIVLIVVLVVAVVAAAVIVLVFLLMKKKRSSGGDTSEDTNKE